MTEDNQPNQGSPQNEHHIPEPAISHDDTQPNRAVYNTSDEYNDRIPAPPRILLIAVIGLFFLAIIGLLSGIVLFREALTQGQQQRVIDMFPFMETFQNKAPTPEGGILQRAGDADEDAANDLLNLNFDSPSVSPATSEPTDDVTPEPSSTLSSDVNDMATSPPTPTPTISPTQTPQPTQTPGSEASVPDTGQTVLTSSAQTWDTSAFNTGFVYYKQNWNNCGPASISIALSYFGWQQSMEYAAARLKPNQDDKNVSPWEMVNFVEQETAVNALWRMGGNLDLLRTLIHNGFPVVIERGQRFEGTEWLGHYQTLVGYDDNLRQFLVFDSFLGNGNGNGRPFDYAEVDGHWREFNRIFLVIYEPSREAPLMDILGDYATLEGSAEVAFAIAQDEARTNPQDPHAWFNMGTSLLYQGEYNAAATAFDRSFDIGLPWRILWYQFGPYEAYFEVGRYQDVLDLVNANLQNGGDRVEETYYWQGRVLAELGRTAEARSAFNRALSRNRLFEQARLALQALNA